MSLEQKTIYVYDDFDFEASFLMGRLYVSSVRGEENFAFEYDDEWLERQME